MVVHTFNLSSREAEVGKSHGSEASLVQLVSTGQKNHTGRPGLKVKSQRSTSQELPLLSAGSTGTVVYDYVTSKHGQVSQWTGLSR